MPRILLHLLCCVSAREKMSRPPKNVWPLKRWKSLLIKNGLQVFMRFVITLVKDMIVGFFEKKIFQKCLSLTLDIIAHKNWTDPRSSLIWLADLSAFKCLLASLRSSSSSSPKLRLLNVGVSLSTSLEQSVKCSLVSSFAFSLPSLGLG